MIELPQNKQLILFDGVCNLCNNSVQYVIKHDTSNTFLFAPLQGETGKAVIKKYPDTLKDVDSIILYNPAKGISTKSTAALRIAKHLRFPVNLVSVFLIIPPFLRNAVYNYIAKNRYKWYGKREHCMIPTKALKNKFLE